MSYVATTKVRFAHCDAAGIVFYPRYFEMLVAVVEDWFAERLGADFSDLHLTRRLGVPTVRLETDFVAPSRLGDILTAELSVARLGTSSCTLDVQFTCEEELRLKVRAVLVAIDLDSSKSLPWPEEIKQAIAAEAES